MQKIITFPKIKGFFHCLDCLMKDTALKAKAQHFISVQSLVMPEEDVETLTALLGKKQRFLVSDNVKVRVHATEQIPWGVERIGAPNYWSTTKGEGVKVAVIDTGISRTHPELRGQVKGRVTLTNNGHGYSKIDGHGTHVAGTIAAVANKQGIVGVAPKVALYDVRAFGPDGTADMSDIVAGMNWAIEQRVDIINMSFGTSQDHPALYSAIKNAARAGVILVASAGNNGAELEFPAAYREVVAVGAVDENDQLAAFSSRGRRMNKVAPGVRIKSTWLNSGYRVLDGTSMAAAHVSGMYALELAKESRRGKR